MTDRSGFALVMAMLLVLALMVMAMGMLAVGTREAWIAAAGARHAQATRAAEGAVLRTVAAWSTRDVAALDVRGSFTPGDPRGVDIERVDSGLFVVAATGRVPGPGGSVTARAALLVRVLHPDRLASSFPAAVSAAGAVTVPEGSVSGGGDACGDPGPGIMAPIATIDPGAAVDGDPPVAYRLPPAPAAPDPFDPGTAAGLAAIHHPGGTVTPAPLATAGECVPGAGNWGSPDPAHPCFRLLPLIVAPDLVMDGGMAHGVLVVDGDLRLTGGAHFDGLIAVRGRLDLDAGSTVRGAVRAGSVVSAGRILRNACAIRRGVSAPAFDGPFRPPERWWIPMF
ncbi:MAG: polymer-forming cytoskeletal protein [Longimicrobiales bacterium]|nr:polymer-forming cytoskeletal protein [Longimicrobiales bacterium]